MTVRKIGVTVGDPWGAMRAARYSLERGEAPAAFAGARYYTAEERALARERPNVIWLGTAPTLEKLGVARGAPVREEELALALQGLRTDGTRVRRPGTRSLPTGELDPDGKPVVVRERRVNSADLTFSAPKSVSVVWSQAGPQLRQQIERAMLEAANAGLEYMMGTKPVVQGRAVPAQGFAASAALQVTARTARGDLVPAPQLHVHGVVVGVDDGDQRLRTPDTAALFKHDAPLEGGAVFRARLAQQLRAIGFELDSGTGRNGRYFQIAGVPQGLIEAMSPRTREVMRMAAEIEARTGEPLTGRARAAIAVMSRTAKDKDVTAAEMMQAWDDLAAEFDFGRGSVEALQGRAPGRRAVGELRDEARAAILARIREQGPTVSAGGARAIAYEVAPLGLTLEEARDLLADLERSGELVALERGLVTTREIRAVEEEVVATARAAAARRTQRVSPAAVAAGTEAAERALGGHELLREQRGAIQTLTSGTGWAALTGRAGTGKGPVLEAVAAAHRADGWQVIAGAVDGATAQRLGHQVKAQALTVDQLLYRESQGTLRLDDRTVVLVDEASKVGLEHWAQIARLVRRDGVRVVAIGHEGQLGAIELPGMFEQMVADAAIPTQRMRTILRHRDPTDTAKVHPWLGKYQSLLDRGEGEQAVATLREHRAISMHATREESIEALVDGWDARRRTYGDARDAILVVHGSNADVDRVNELAQQRRLDAGDLGQESVAAVDRGYRIRARDVVMLRESAYDAGDGERRVENGTIGIVDSVDARADVVWVRLEEPGVDSRLVAIRQDELRRRVQRGERQVPALRLAYAFHPFPLQGATVKDVAVLGGHWSQDKEGTYTADTRAQLRLHVHVDRESLGLDGSDEDRWLRYARRVTVSQERMASIALEVTRESIVVDLPRGEPVPDLARAPVEQDVPVGRTVEEALASWRDVLGDLRSEQLATGAAQLREELRELDEAWLRSRREALGDPFAALHRGGARETLRIERDKLVLNERIDAAEAEAEVLTARAQETPALRRRERAGLSDAAATQRELARLDLDRLGALHEVEADLRRSGHHLDDWWDAHAVDAVRALAIDEELAARHERDEAIAAQWEPEVEPQIEYEQSAPELDL